MNRGYARSDIYGYGSNNRADADSAADRDFEENIWNDYGKEDRTAAHTNLLNMMIPTGALAALVFKAAAA